MIEEWRDIEGYSGRYQISNLGNVRTNDFNHSGKMRLMRIATGTRGYKQICLTKNNKRSTKRIHRLVAEAFIPNPHNYPTVNHIDENKSNNRSDNLEWCSFEYNTKYGTRTERTGNPVLQMTMNGEVIGTYVSSKEAERQVGVDHTHILNCCHGKKHCISAGGFKWKFAERGESLRIK